MSAAWRFLLAILTFGSTVLAQSYSAPAGLRPAARRPGAAILPGGRIIAPHGLEAPTGAGVFGLAVSASGRTVITANTGPGRNSLTVMERDKAGKWEVRQLMARTPNTVDEFDAPDWRGVFMGLAFASEHSVYASEGNSGKIGLFDWNSSRRRVIDLNQNGFDDSYTGDLALDGERGILYAVDQANFRIAVIDTKSNKVIHSVRVGRLPFAVALSPDRRKLYVTNVGMFEYQAVPGVDRKRAKETGLPFPAFGFPSAESVSGVERETATGPVKVAGLGDPNVPESNSVCVVDVSTPAAAKVESFIRTGLPYGKGTDGGSSPSGVLAAAGRIFVTNAANDSISVIDPATNTIESEIAIRIPGLETLRGVLPIGMAWHEKSGWLLVAEAGINAVAVIDTREKRVLGHIPTAWFPTRVAIEQDTVFVASAKGHGVGPNAPSRIGMRVSTHELRRGSVAMFPLPAASELATHTAFVMQANGFDRRGEPPEPLPSGIRHVVVIVKENRTYDEVFGDIDEASNGPAMWAPELARFGLRGYVDGKGKRLSLKDVNVTPNHHAIARRWGFSDNFYADSDVSVDGHHWLVGAYPTAWTESSLLASYSDQKKEFRLGSAPGRLSFAESNSSVHPEEQIEGGTIWHHLARHNVSFYNFGEGFELAGNDEGRDLEPTGARFVTNVPMPEPLYRNTSRNYPGFNMNIPDQYRANQFIQEVEEKFVKGGTELPRFLFIHLPNDHMTEARAADGYPYNESFVADNDYALGRIVEYLSGTKWWGQMAILVTEDDAQGGVDHIDAHRTVLLCAGPWCKKNYVSHVNSSFPGLLKTAFRLLNVPPLNLFDAVASDLSDLFTSQPDPSRYRALDVDHRIFDPAKARISTSGKPSVRMDQDR